MWEKELNVAKEAATASGKILIRLFGQVSHVIKKGDIDLVTEADFQSEKTVIEIIRRHFPQDSILSEEVGGYERSSNRTWLIDPLDGTTNFVHGFPFFAVSIALEIDKELVIGVVLNPFMDELFERLINGGIDGGHLIIGKHIIPAFVSALLHVFTTIVCPLLE